jgi:polysaccharide biosynthesis transport protein
MNNNRQIEQPGKITLGDIYFVIFRNKWKIIFLSAAGIVAAVAFYFLNPPIYQSEAELLIKYITDTKPNSSDNNQNTTSIDVRGDVIGSEIDILKSFDLAQEVVTNIGAEKILAKAGGGKDPMEAAGLVKQGLLVEQGDKSSVITIDFQHPDPTIVQPILNEIISDYVAKHLAIHQALGISDDFLTEETTQLRAQIDQTERDLMAAKNNAGIISSLEDSKKAISDQMEKINGEIMDAETELASRSAMASSADVSPREKQPATNMMAEEATADQVDQYEGICSHLSSLLKKEQDYFSEGYADQNRLVKEVRSQIAQAKEDKQNLEEKYPSLAGSNLAALASGGLPGDALTASHEDSTQMLKTKVQILNTQLATIRDEAAKIGEAEPKIMELQSKLQIQQENYQFFSKSQAQALIDEQPGSGRGANINSVQQPTPAFRAVSKVFKIMSMMVAGGIAAGLGLAFLIEMFFDRTVKRPVEIENKLKLPLFLSIPDVSRGNERKRAALLAQAESVAMEKAGLKPMEIAPWSANHSLRSFYEALRDRIVVYFDVKNVTHNPKLVAVTSANRGAGVTTMAMGLAASLSETGEGNVLLVDMNVEQGAVQQFYKGKPGCHLDDAFVKEKRGGALMQDNLYVVSESSNGDKLPRILPKRFNTLMPKFKASDYDYIIFDMPPVTQTSVTPRLSGFMDMVLLVVEAEKTDQEVVRRASALLKESKANVISVLNKARKYVPDRLHQEFLSDR